MIKPLQTKIISYQSLFAKRLINDLKEAATCEVIMVCRLACDHCPYLHKNIDPRKIKLKGLSGYNIKLDRVENDGLLVSISAPNIGNWLPNKE